MDFPFADCATSADFFPVSRARELLRWEHEMAFVLLDLARTEERREQLSGAKNSFSWLARQEQQDLERITSVKRRREWFGGRMAAKYAGADILARSSMPLPWAVLAIQPDENGRPFLAAGSRMQGLPDISISHSGNQAGAMAVSPGLCGMDIQEVTERVVKVRERFCTLAEESVINSWFGSSDEQQLLGLTKLWAAKEALRKVAATPVLPGFLDLVLTDISRGGSRTEPASWRLVFQRRKTRETGNRTALRCSVAVCNRAGYVLALTARKDTP